MWLDWTPLSSKNHWNVNVIILRQIRYHDIIVKCEVLIMIERYSSPEMIAIWSEKNKFQSFLEVELAVLESYACLGMIPVSDVEAIKKHASFDVNAIHSMEKTTKHDVIAFTRTISQSLGEEKKWFHYGLTSTDVVDTANGLRIKAANDLLVSRIDALLDVLNNKAILYSKTPCIGRTHGIHAEVMSFGLKYALWFDELNRIRNRFISFRPEIEVAKLSGAVGNYANIPIEVENQVAKQLGLYQTAISTQVVSRDRYVTYFMLLSQIAQVIEKIAMEVRHLSRSEIYEVSEDFSNGQKGSSAMPHKQNPIASENMCGISRLVRSFVQVAMDNNLLWHERDISHSSNERIILEDGPSLVYYMLVRYTAVLKTLVVRPHIMIKNIHMNGNVIFSGRVLSALIDAGMTREMAYDLIQPLAFQAMEDGKDFYDLLLTSAVTKFLTGDQIKSCFDIEYYLKNTQKIYERVGIAYDTNISCNR